MSFHACPFRVTPSLDCMALRGASIIDENALGGNIIECAADVLPLLGHNCRLKDCARRRSE